MAAITEFFNELYQNLERWFFEKEQHHRKFLIHRFLMDSLWLISAIILFIVFYNNFEVFGEITILFIKIGGLINLILAVFILWKIYKIIINLKDGSLSLSNGFKIMTLIMLLIVVLIIYKDQEVFVSSLFSFFQKINLHSFNPFGFS